MQLMQKYEVDIDYCPQCNGVWLDRGEMDKIANIQYKYEDAHYQKYHYGGKNMMTTTTTMITITDEERGAIYLILID